MIQVSRRSWNGSIKYCRIHDLLRELAIEKAKENNFLEILSNQGDQSCSSVGTIRRATLHCHRDDIMKYTGPNLRSLLHFGDHMQKITGFRYLKVFHQRARDLGRFEYNISKKMSQLRYLGTSSLRRRHLYYEGEIKLVWKIIGRLGNLQTLDFGNFSGDASGSDCIWNIKTLRHVILRRLDPFKGPPSTADLPNLQTLKTVWVREEWLVKGWPKLPSIRVLWLRDFPPECHESFRIFLNELHHLTSLYITGTGVGRTSSYEVFDMSTIPSYNHLQSLLVNGEWDWKYWNPMSGNALDIRLFPIHLIKLTLMFSDVKEDPMPVLEKLRSLRKLMLYVAYDGKKLSCSAGGFPRLEYMVLYGLQYLEDWKVEKGGMPLLQDILIESCSKLVAIPELQHMTSINNLSLKGVHPDLLKRLEGDESYKIQNIPLIEMF